MRFPGMCGGSSTLRSTLANCEATWNWYVEPADAGLPKASPVLFPTPGFTTFVTLPGSTVRGLFAQNDRCFGVCDDGLYEISKTRAVTPRPMTALVTPGQATLTLSAPINPLTRLNPPVLYNNGTAATTTYGYKVTATNILGETDASLESLITTGPATLNTIDYLLVTWTLASGATGYKVYRTTGGTAPPRLIATIANPAQSTYSDVGPPDTAVTPPVANTTGSPAPSATWGYRVVATNLTGTTLPGVEATILGYPLLSAQHTITITWPRIANAVGYVVYRTTAPAIGTVGANTLTVVATITGNATTTATDIGAVAGPNDVAPVLPVSNTTLAPGLVNNGTPVSISSSGDEGGELFIVSAGHGYIFNLDTNSLTEVVQNVTQGGFIDGFFVAFDGGTSTMRISRFLDGLTWDPTQIAQRTVAGDRWLAMTVTHREIWLFGSQTTEVWVNRGTAPFPFGPNPNVFIETGCGALWSPARAAQSVLWLGQDIQGGGVVYRANGYAADRVSTYAVETALQGFAYLGDGEGWGYQDGGHTFYVLTFPAAGQTWVLDVGTGVWAQRGTWNILAGRFDAYRPRCHAFAFSGLGAGIHLVGDRVSGVVAQMALDVGTELGGGVIRRVRRAPHVHSNRLRLTFRGVEVDLERGLGLPNLAPSQTTPGVDPVMQLRWSDDGGKTWSNIHTQLAGKQGEYTTRVYWTRLGSGRDRVFEFSVTDPIPWRIVDATIDVEQGNN